MLHKKYLSILQRNRVNFLLFVLFTFVLFFKCVLFHWDAFNSILISSLWKNPLSFYKFYMAKLLMPMFISSFIFISKSHIWTIVISFLIDVWCIANLIYYKTYDSFLSINDILLVGNMDGAWSSISAYFDWSMVTIIVLTIFWITILCFLFRFSKNKPQWLNFTLSLLVIILLTIVNNFFIYGKRFSPEKLSDKNMSSAEERNEWNTFVNEHGGDEWQYDSWINYLPFVSIYSIAIDKTKIETNFMEQYIRQQSIISDFIAINIYYIFHNDKAGDIILLSDTDVKSIRPFFKTDKKTLYPPNDNLIILLVESLESWPIQSVIEGYEITPFLKKFIKQENILYCDKIKCQTLAGNSADGQMLVNSGLLPIQHGVACMHYGNNVFPNIAHFYPNSILINPWPKIWNQDTMSVRYSYTQKIEPKLGQWEDEQVFNASIEYLKKNEKPMMLFALTVSTHSPFNRVENNKIQTTAPTILNRYMQCLNYTDSCIGEFMEYALSDPILSKSTIVITSDHTIFKPSMLTEFMDYAVLQNLPIMSGENYCPLIIYSPKIKGNVHVSDLCYQMDIFPTILNLIGCEEYYWQGFGVNLLDSIARHNRLVTEEEAYVLSDKIIRSNYFEQYID